MAAGDDAGAVPAASAEESRDWSELTPGAGGSVAGRHGVLPLLEGRGALPSGALRGARPRPRIRHRRWRRRRHVVDARLPAPRRRHAPRRRRASRWGAPRQTLL
jgi:hypothetical protein